MMIGRNNSTIDSGTNLNLILRHLQPPIFPRTISTKNTADRQIVVYNEEEILSRFRDSDFTDCRINSHPNTKGMIPPSLIFIDLDRSNFKTNLGLTRALNSTIDNIGHKLNGHPTVLSTGGGFHIIQPLQAMPLERVSDFNEVENPSTKFLRFAARFLSNNKSDPNNFQSTKSCMLRIPGSVNSKYPDKIQVRQSWDGYRPDFSLLLGSFHAHILSEKIKNKRLSDNKSKSTRDGSTIRWIETLLQMPLEDFRKTAVSLIFAPYLVNIKRLSDHESHEIIRKWLMKCNSLKPVDLLFSRRVKYILLRVTKNGYRPLSQQSLKTRNPVLYDKLMQ